MDRRQIFAVALWRGIILSKCPWRITAEGWLDQALTAKEKAVKSYVELQSNSVIHHRKWIQRELEVGKQRQQEFWRKERSGRHCQVLYRKGTGHKTPYKRGFNLRHNADDGWTYTWVSSTPKSPAAPIFSLRDKKRVLRNRKWPRRCLLMYQKISIKAREDENAKESNQKWA